MIDVHPNHNPDPKIDLTVPYEIVRILDKGRCVVNAMTEVTKCPDCDEEIRYGGSWNVSVLELFTEDQLNTMQLIQAEHGTKDAIDYYDIVVNGLVAAHPPRNQVDV